MSIVTGAFVVLMVWVSIVSSQEETQEGPVLRIVGGTTATHMQFPHQASLQINGNHFCGGSIISSSKILTAAHCVADTEPKQITVVVGTIKISRSGEKYRVRRLRIHPSYDSRLILNDVAVLQTEGNILFSSYVQPIRLATSPPTRGMRVTASGWGLLQLNGAIPEKLQYVHLQIFDQATCASIWQSYHYGINNNHICTTSRVGEGTCKGDSGGPLIDSISNYQVGVVSFGYPCAKGLPDVFASVAFYYKWILEQY